MIMAKDSNNNYVKIEDIKQQNSFNGVSPIKFKGSGENLENYRIYGNTIGGESVGDRTANLFDGNFLQGYWAYADGGFIYVNTWICTNKIPCTGGQAYTYSFSQVSRWFGFVWYDGDGNYISTNNLQNNSDVHYRSYSATSPANAAYMVVNIAGYPSVSATISPADVTDFMLVEGSTALPYEPYGYKVPVTVEGKNLFDEKYDAISSDNITYKAIYIGNNICTLSTDMPLNNVLGTNLFLLTGNVSTGAATPTNGVYVNHSKTVASTNGYVTIAYRSYDITPIDYHTQLEKGSTATAYEPYRTPITTPIYLPEPIKMVGDEAEYIDYGEQKWHRVRKNLLQNTATSQTINGVTFTVNDDGSVTCNGTASENAMKNINLVSFKLNNFILNGCPTGGGWDTFQFDIIQAKSPYTVLYRDIGTGVSVDTLNENVYFRIRIASGYTCNNLTFFPMIRLATIEDDTYEPYIADTELDVTLPALPTLSGTNTLSVGTEIKPSKVWGRLSDPRDIEYVKDNLGNILFSKYHEVEDEPPLTFKAKKEGALKDYRIYGNTVNGESVGDLMETGEHAGEYRVPVTIEGKNLLQNTATSQTINGVTFTVNDDGSITCNGTAEQTIFLSINNFIKIDGNVILSGCPDGGGSDSYMLRINSSGTITTRDQGSGANAINPRGMVEIRILSGYTCNNVTFYPMIRKADIENDTYEPYHALVTTPIYLPEPIKMVGSEVEYVDYVEQKQHRVRKNLLQNKATSQTISGVTFTVNSDGSVTCDGTASSVAFFAVAEPVNLSKNIISGCPRNGSYNSYLLRYQQLGSSYVEDTGNGVLIPDYGDSRVIIRINAGYTCTNLTFYPMIRKADISDDTYEPYITNTELDVTLPALPTLSGTNTLSVGTEVQPSEVYIKGKIKEIN